MFRDIRKNKVFNRRVFVITAGQAVLTSALVSRLGFLQIYKHGDYSIQSDSNSIKPVFIAAQRGEVYDRNGLALTDNQEKYQLFLYIESKKKVEDFVDTLSEVLMLGPKRKKILYKRATKAKRRSITLLMDSMSWSDLSRVESAFYKLDGAIIESHFIRSCLFPYEMAHIVGYVSLPNKRDLADSKDMKPVLLTPGFRIGRSGLEKSYDDSLRGKYGVKYVEVDSTDKPLRLASQVKPKQGDNLVTTIDYSLQKFTYDRLKNLIGSVVVFDVKTGEVLTCVSSPSFDVNKFSHGISAQDWQDLNSDPDLPLNNRAISAIYPPGSVFKIMTAIAGLENGIDPEKIVTCKGHEKYGNRRFHCWKKEGHGRVNLSSAIQQSCNIYFFELAQKLGIDKINEVARRFGYGESFDIGLEGVSVGNLPSDKWKRKVFKRGWVGGDTLNCAIGQGFILSTPFQVALAMARFANGGYKIEPSLIKNMELSAQIESGRASKIIKEGKHFAFINKALSDVVNSEDGTAYYQRIREKGFEMAGKTGTSQAISKRADELSRSESRVRENKNHAIFAGYAPFHEPKYAISVVIEHGGSGSVAAAPVARDVLLKAQKLKI